MKPRFENFMNTLTFRRHTIPTFSAPGRTEIGGNHTDHNNGKVLAASVNLDIIAVASPWEENRIN